MTPEALDRLIGPIALYPDQLLAQMLMDAQNPGNVEALRLWMDKNKTLKGSELQDAAVKQGFDASLVVLVLFPDVVTKMSDQLEWTTNIGVAFTMDRSAVFASIQRLRKQASSVGTLKTTPQQSVETKTTTNGEQVQERGHALVRRQFVRIQSVLSRIRAFHLRAEKSGEMSGNGVL